MIIAGFKDSVLSDAAVMYISAKHRNKGKIPQDEGEAGAR